MTFDISNALWETIHTHLTFKRRKQYSFLGIQNAYNFYEFNQIWKFISLDVFNQKCMQLLFYKELPDEANFLEWDFLDEDWNMIKLYIYHNDTLFFLFSFLLIFLEWSTVIKLVHTNCMFYWRNIHLEPTFIPVQKLNMHSPASVLQIRSH